MWSYVILMAAKYRKAGIWLHVKIQNVTSDTCELLQSPNSGFGCSKAAASLQLKVGHKLEEKITSVACFMGWIVKYHLGSCQHMTKYRKTKWPVGREKHALKGKVRHDGLFFALCSASCSPKEAALFSTGRSLCFFFLCLLKVIKILSKGLCSLMPYVLFKNKTILLIPYSLSVDFSEIMEINLIQEWDWFWSEENGVQLWLCSAC